MLIVPDMWGSRTSFRKVTVLEFATPDEVRKPRLPTGTGHFSPSATTRPRWICKRYAVTRGLD